jgi:hypothetical protein
LSLRPAKPSGVVAARARDRAVDLAPILAELQASGVTTLHGLAAALNESDIPTASGAGQWQATSVSRLRARLPAIRWHRSRPSKPLADIATRQWESPAWSAAVCQDRHS